MTTYSPWSSPPDPEILFRIDAYNHLLRELGWPDKNLWLNHWRNRGGINLASESWIPGTKTDWAWGIGLPFLSDVERYLFNEDGRKIFGISGLPGSGKTTFGRWVEAAASELNWPLKVLSMDDFYLPHPELELAMAGNPWDVPRGLPGSHDVQLMEKTITIWQETGYLKAPQFDKALRDGSGDRCGWVSATPQILIIEGWFLGCDLSNHEQHRQEILTPREEDYQLKIQDSLKTYQAVWKKFERVWHIKANDFLSMRTWKAQQEENLQKTRGASLEGHSLTRFIRMLETAIPQGNLQSIKSDVIAILNKARRITWVGGARLLQ